MTNKPAYPGRDQLDTANQRFRRALARLNREAIRHDNKLLPEVERLALKAAEVLNGIAQEAENAEGLSQRHQAALKREEDRMRATLKKLSHSGQNERAANLLQQVEEMSARRLGRLAEFQGRDGA
ncbi:hypothetical protein ACIRJL_17205 [Streptomyces sp. NPDC102383]|uniref:hypothetical protein n=1 Tax=Streptomyces sp. NPDC102383 TaxID=3366165 RepID=UPI00381B96FB